MRRIITAAAALLVAITFATPGATAQSTATVEVQDNQFVESTVTVTVGDTVTWTHTGANPHTITAADGSFDSHPDCPPDFSACMAGGDTYQQTFAEAGTFAYYCKVHGNAGGSGMAGTIVVQAADDAGESGSGDDTAADDSEATVTGAMEAGDQDGDGTTVRIASVTIEGANGFVVIHADGGGSPGAVIGHAAISEGTSTDVTVTLDTPLTASANVFPMLHLDAGEVGAYEFPGPDGPVSDADGVITFPISYSVAAETLPSTGLPAWVPWLAAMGVLAGLGAVLGSRRREGAGTG